MARPLRIEYPGAYYHVMNRGNRREDIFLTDKDRKVFLDGLADSCEIYSIKLISYVLMSNHFHYGWLLSTYFGEDTAKGRRKCREYVYQAIEGEIENPFEEVVHQSILGAQDFVEWVRQKLPQKGRREMPSLKKLQHHISVEHIIMEVAKAGNAQAENLRGRKTNLKDFKQMAMELSKRYSNYKQKEIGAIFGVDYSTVSQSRSRLKTKLKSNPKLKRQFQRIREQINKLSNTKI